MAYFNPEAFEMLLMRARSTGPEDLELLRDATKDCLHYVQTVCDGENLLNTADEPDRSMAGDYDAKRHSAHENAITSAALLNRFALQQGCAPAFTGDTAERHQVADFCIEMTDWLFRNRRRVL